MLVVADDGSLTSGGNVGRKIARDGTVVQGTDEALRKELHDAFHDLHHADYIVKIKKRIKTVCDEMRKDVEDEEGGSYAAVKQLAFLA